jgi:hypothetical protein
MGTIALYVLFNCGSWKGYDDRLSKIGNILSTIFGCLGLLIYFIIFTPLAIVENVFILPVWCGYNLCHKKELRKTYESFLRLYELKGDNK